MKNKFMRIAAVMLMLCLVTTCAISGTFAKYTTEVAGDDTARVAYWGFNGTNADLVTIKSLFAESYNTGKVNTANVGEKIIAPGTGNKATFVFNYVDSNFGAAAPEVAYTLTIDASASSIDPLIEANNNIKWAVYEQGTDENLIAWGTFADMIDAIEALDDDESFDANELAPIANTTYVIAWNWAFEGPDGNAEDTALGNSVDALEVVVSIKITATQA